MEYYEFESKTENEMEDISEVSLMFSLKINSLIDIKGAKIKIVNFENNGITFDINIIEYENIIISVNGCFTNIETMFSLLFTKFFKIEQIDFKILSIKELDLDIIIPIDVSKLYFIEDAIKVIKTIGLICNDIDFYDNSSRKKFINIYNWIKNINPGKCQTGGNKLIKLLKIICNYYSLADIDINYSLFAGFDNLPILDKKLNITMVRKFVVRHMNDNDENIRSDKKMLVISISIGDTTGDNIISPHANLLIIDNVNKTIERFEPNGSLKFDGYETDFNNIFKIVDFKLKEYFIRDEYYKDYQFISTLDYCPNIGPQIKIGNFSCESGGFCGTLSTIYGLLRMVNPEYTREEIINVMFKYNSLDLRRFVSFINMVVNI